MLGEHEREGAGCDNGTSLVLSVTGHRRGRHSSAGCGGRRCCSNVLRELASFVSDRPTQLQLRVFIYTKTAVKSHIKKYPQIVAHGWSPIDQSVYFPRRSGSIW